MRAAISPTRIVKTRPGFGQTIKPKPGAIVASPVLASWDPDPDYFFHWFRDSAIAIDALRVLHQDGTAGPEALADFRDFVGFSLSLQQLAGKPLVEDKSWRARTIPDFQCYLRSDEELSGVTPETVVAETRVNPDGTLDISRWSRPQHDGPALRILIVLRWLMQRIALDDDCRRRAALLLHSDIDFILAHSDEPDFDMWEEEKGRNYYTDRLMASALEQAAAWFNLEQHQRKAAACRHSAAHISRRLDDYWLESDGFYRSRLAGTPSKHLDISVIFAILHSGEDGPLHGLRDMRVLATLARLEVLFAKDYAINHDRPAEREPALGRYEGDVYFSGGAYYFSTLAAAEFYYRLAAATPGDLSRAYKRRGDGFLETVRAFTPESGELSEQFDRSTGQQTSAKNLAWSHAGLITAVAARRALQPL
jgi:glucoamylase